jgi:hypothetical protein
MNPPRNSLLTTATILCLVGAFVLTPLSVGYGADTAKQPFPIEASFVLPVGESSTSVTAFKVPANKRLTIEFVSAIFFRSTTDTSATIFMVTQGGGRTAKVFLYSHWGVYTLGG